MEIESLQIHKQVKMRSYRVRVGPKSNDWYSYKKRDLETQGTDSHVKIEVDIGVRLPQARARQGPRTTIRSQQEVKNDSSLEPGEGAWPT